MAGQPSASRPLQAFAHAQSTLYAASYRNLRGGRCPSLVACPFLPFVAESQQHARAQQPSNSKWPLT